MFDGKGIGKGLDALKNVAIFGVVVILGLIILGVYKGIKYLVSDGEVIETKTLLKPTIKININGGKSDTTYTYTIPK
jgi:hypothetical protein